MDAINRVEDNRVVTSPDAAGPWDARMQHGSAPAALVVWAAEAIPTSQPMRIARVTIDLMRPVPVAPLTLETEIVRKGRKIQLCAVRLLAKDVVVVGATILKIRTQALTLPPEVEDLPVGLPGPDQAREEQPDFSSSPFVTGISMRAAAAGSACPVPARSGIGSTGHWSKARRCRRRCAPWSPRISATARQRCSTSRHGPSSMPTSPSVLRGSRSANGFCSMRNPGSALTGRDFR
jgi:hypothetical protein